MSKKVSLEIQKKKQELAELESIEREKQAKEEALEEAKHLAKLKKKFDKMSQEKKLKILETVVQRCSYECLSDDEYFDGYKELAEMTVAELKKRKTNKNKA